MVKSFSGLLNSNTNQSKSFDVLFSSLSQAKQERVNSLVKHLEKYSISSDLILRKCITQPVILGTQIDKIISHINANTFFERQKNPNKEINEIVQSVIERKNLGQSNDSIYAPFLVSQIFKSVPKPSEFKSSRNPLNAIKRYFRQNPDAKVDEVLIINDIFASDFIEFTKKLSEEIVGHDRLFKVSAVKNADLIKKTKLKTNEKVNIRNLITDMRKMLSQNGDNINKELLGLMRSLPEQNWKRVLILIHRLNKTGEDFSKHDVLKMCIKYPAFFTRDVKESFNLIMVKRFILKSSNKNADTSLNSLLKCFYGEYTKEIVYSNFLIKKMFPNSKEIPWYLRGKNDLSEGISFYLSKNPTKKFTIEAANDIMTENFIQYTDALVKNSKKAKESFNIIVK